MKLFSIRLVRKIQITSPSQTLPNSRNVTYPLVCYLNRSVHVLDLLHHYTCTKKRYIENKNSSLIYLLKNRICITFDSHWHVSHIHDLRDTFHSHTLTDSGGICTCHHGRGICTCHYGRGWLYSHSLLRRYRLWDTILCGQLITDCECKPNTDGSTQIAVQKPHARPYVLGWPHTTPTY